MKEKRKHLRFNVLLDALCRLEESSKKLTISDFSREGLGILSNEPIPRGKELEIELLIPGDNLPVIVSGEIAWTEKERSKGKCYKSGVKLKKISKSDRTHVLSYIYKKMVNTKK